MCIFICVLFTSVSVSTGSTCWALLGWMCGEMKLLGSYFLGYKIQPPLQNDRIIHHGKDSSCSLAQLLAQSEVSYGIRLTHSGLSESFIMSLGNLLQNLTTIVVKNFLPQASQSCELLFSLCCSFSSQQLAWDCVLDLCWKVLITHGCSASAEQCSHRVKDFSASHCLASQEPGGAQEAGRVTAGKDDPKWPKRYSSIILSNKSTVKEWGRRHLGVLHMLSVFPSMLYSWWSPAFLEIAKYLTMASDEWIPYFALFACANFSFNFSIVFISTHEFFYLYTSDSLPHPTWEEWANCQAGLSHNIPIQNWLVFIEDAFLSFIPM